MKFSDFYKLNESKNIILDENSDKLAEFLKNNYNEYSEIKSNFVFDKEKVDNIIKNYKNCVFYRQDKYDFVYIDLKLFKELKSQNKDLDNSVFIDDFISFLLRSKEEDFFIKLEDILNSLNHEDISKTQNKYLKKITISKNLVEIKVIGCNDQYSFDIKELKRTKNLISQCKKFVQKIPDFKNCKLFSNIEIAKEFILRKI